MPLDVAVAGGLNGTSVAARLRVARERVPGAWDTFGQAAPTAAVTRPGRGLPVVLRRALARRYDLPISQVVNAARPVRGVAARPAGNPAGRGRRRPGSRYGSFQTGRTSIVP